MNELGIATTRRLIHDNNFRETKMRGRNLTDYQRELIQEKSREGKAIKVIAQEIGRSYSCVYFNLKNS
jgi:IS30 family transposase